MADDPFFFWVPVMAVVFILMCFVAVFYAEPTRKKTSTPLVDVWSSSTFMESAGTRKVIFPRAYRSIPAVVLMGGHTATCVAGVVAVTCNDMLIRTSETATLRFLVCGMRG